MADDNRFVKHPNAVLEYEFDWAPLTNERAGAESDWLELGEEINTYTITISPTGELTKDSDLKILSDTAVRVWLSAGVEDTEYTVTCEIDTSSSPARTDVRHIKVYIGNIQDEEE